MIRHGPRMALNGSGVPWHLAVGWLMLMHVCGCISVEVYSAFVDSSVLCRKWGVGAMLGEKDNSSKIVIYWIC